jgi:hypothetical protein
MPNYHNTNLALLTGKLMCGQAENFSMYYNWVVGYIATFSL